MLTTEEYMKHFAQSESREVKTLAQIIAGNLEMGSMRQLEGFEALDCLVEAEAQRNILRDFYDALQLYEAAKREEELSGHCSNGKPVQAAIVLADARAAVAGLVSDTIL